MKFYVLGPLVVLTDAGPVNISAKRLRAVLGILLLNPSIIVPVDQIIEGVWPRHRPRSAVENVRTYIWQLRSMLRDAGDDGRLESHVGGYRLRAEPEELDMLRFTILAMDGKLALRRGNFTSAVVILEQALSLWRGEALAELELGPSARVKTLALDEQRRSLELNWISARLALAEHAEMVAMLRKLTAERPLDENLWRYLVVTLYSLGRTAEALSAYAEARHQLVSELGIEPGPELRKVQVAILRGKEVPEVLVPAVASGLPGPRTIPRQMPATVPGYVGRQVAVDEVRMLVGETRLDSAEHRPVVIVSGPPGVGKSAMAIAAATMVLSNFPDGQLYIDLRGSTDWPLSAADVLASVLDGFGLHPDALPTSVDRRRALYRSLLAERRMLILLDNAITISQVAPLVPGHGPSLLLVTSRRHLAGIDAGVRINLKPLSAGDAMQMLGKIAGHDRVRRELSAAHRIVDACGRLPLAIRIAGDRLAARPDHPLWMFAKRLAMKDRILDELTLDGLAIRAWFDSSYQILDPSAQRCFRLLGLLEPAAITATDLGELLKVPPDVADWELERLVHEGLMFPETVHPNASRYRMPSLLHVYARERLAREGVDLLATSWRRLKTAPVSS